MKVMSRHKKHIAKLIGADFPMGAPIAVGEGEASPRLTAGRAGGYAVVKRAFDVILSLLLLSVLALPMLLVSVLIRSDSYGPALFVQERVGKDQKPFRILKFRTMRTDAPRNRPSVQLSGEERQACVTRVGRFLRRTSLDELPQLWNVLVGEMSLVGPRPVIAEEAELVALRASLGAYAVRPGLTGLAQISGRDEADVISKARLDALYASGLSFALDLRIFFSTFGAVLSGKGGN